MIALLKNASMSVQANIKYIYFWADFFLVMYIFISLCIFKVYFPKSFLKKQLFLFYLII